MEKKYIEVNEGELIRWRGLWSVGTESYALGDVVAHAKSGYGTCTYKARVGHVPSAATEPEDGASWDTVWEEFLMGGQNGTGKGTGDVIAAGKAGGQTILGGTGAGEELTLGSTAHATKGREKLLDPAYFAAQLGDLISWYDNRIGVGAAYCTGIESDTLYWRSSKNFRWYIGCLADSGTSDSMQLSAAGLDLPVGLLTPKIRLTGPVKQSILSKTANYTITDTDPDIVVIGVISAHATITLPTAADNIGRIITVIIDGEPGAYNVVVDGEGSETINGAATKTNSVIYSCLQLLCNGVGWDIIGSGGTWT
jgi:hypothetical protein